MRESVNMKRLSASMGLTLIELMVAMTVGMVVLGALTTTLILQRKAYAIQEQVVEMTQTARAAMDIIGREVRMAGYCNPEIPMQRNHSAEPNFVGIPVSSSRLEIFADLTGDGDTSDMNEHIIYTFDPKMQMIRRNTGGGAQPFAENIEAFSFQYLDANGDSVTMGREVRKIRITLTARTVKPDPQNPDNGYASLALSEDIFPRNLELP
jgi:type IV pilus assembly protein PilW